MRWVAADFAGCLSPRIPTGFKSISPGLAVRAGQARSDYPGKPFPKLINAVAAVCDRRLSLLSEWMKSLKNSLSKTLRGMNVPAPHWQKGFFDHVMRSEESYSEKWLYVAENPIRKKLGARFEDWPYQGEIYPLLTSGHV